MIEFKISKKRWHNMLDAFISLGAGKVGQTLKIHHRKDDFESLESIFNLMNEELSERLLHLSFIKPNDFQKLHKHYLLFLNKDFIIKNTCESFLTDFDVKLNQIKGLSLFNIIDKSSANYIEEFFAKPNQSLSILKPNMLLFDDFFFFNIKILQQGNAVIINLYQLYIESKNAASLNQTNRNHSKLKQRKRYEIIIEEIKMYIDSYPLNQKLSLKQLSLDFGINSYKLKIMFKEQYQCNVYEYFISIRMKHALILIETGTLAFKEIAYMVGYNDYSSFVKFFKRHYHLLPNQVRLKAQEAVN